MLPIFTKKKKWILIPIEVKVREFESRLLVSLYAISKNFNIIFGDQKQILRNLKYFPKGIYFDKSISKNKYDSLRIRKDMGFALTSIDEEGLPQHMNGFMYLKQRISENTLRLVEKFFVWGADEKRVIIDAYPKMQKKVFVTGNPRVDLWRGKIKEIHSEKAKEYKKMYGKYILIPSNFSCNHINGINFLIKQAWEYGILSNKNEELYYRKYLNFDKLILKKFYNLVFALSKKFKDYTIILRPHPGEDKSKWTKSFRGIQNVRVSQSGSLTPWILGADLIIHSSCTSGLEGYCLGKSVLTYLPFGKNNLRSHISDELSEKTFQIPQLIHLSNLRLKHPYQLKNKKIKKILKNSFNVNKNNYAYKNIVNHLLKINCPKNSFNVLKFLEMKIKNGLKTHYKNSDYELQKFLKLEKIEIQETALKIKKHHRSFSVPKIAKLDKNLFILYA